MNIATNFTERHERYTYNIISLHISRMAIIPSDNNKSQFSKMKSEYNFVSPTGDGFQTRRIIRMEETRTITNTTLSHLLVEPCHKEEKKTGTETSRTTSSSHLYDEVSLVQDVGVPGRWKCVLHREYCMAAWSLYSIGLICDTSVEVLWGHGYAWLIGAITPRLEFLKLSVYTAAREPFMFNLLCIKMER